VLRKACEQALRCKSLAGDPIRIAVNVSSRQLAREGLVDSVVDALAATGLDPRLLELELTENGIMENVETATGIVDRLKGMGVRIAIDDFGTGHSSMSRLKRFHLDTLKIDRSFVSELTTDPIDAAIGTAIITMAHGLRLDVIAEGVETKEQLAV